MRGEPVDERCRELRGGAALPARPERVLVKCLDAPAPQPCHVAVEALLQPEHRIVDGTSRQVRPGEGDGSCDECVRVVAHAVEADCLT